ncbi:hypothetical protein ACFQ3P_04620 [Paraburkholderia sabiae]|uniref:PNPLA domain-containing protein n=1 Tax=Paraburkholderia sabiae TaxID=273251 RepID=A0ABU9QMJ4_9BURK|nr:hypothetical protein [Paraburkholderia sabiae]WJZ79147.1 hypothetical protein QEN71_34825 [Paraburkholderia sabiae]CAD6514460.1 hypothetical protein LMG24235_00924 [Paraburkholderia sabiae]
MATLNRRKEESDAKPSGIDYGPVSRAIAWIMPWVFLALRRALIPTLCILALAVLFYLVPQSQDVLIGLAEYVAQDALIVWNWTGLASYLVSSILVSLAVWYCARLLCTVEAWLGMPMAWEVHHFGTRQAELGEAQKIPRDDVRVRKAIRWMPRAYGVGTLATTAGALAFAHLEPQWRASAGVLLVIVILGGPLLATVGLLRLLRHRAARPDRRGERQSFFRFGSIAQVITGFAVYACASFALVRSSSAWPVALLCAVWALLPGVLLYLLVTRRALVRYLFSWDLPQADDGLHFTEVIVQVVAFVVLGFAALAGLAAGPTVIIRGIGSAATVMLFLAAAVFFFCGIQLVLRWISRAVPGFTSLVAIILFLIASYFGREPLGKETLDPRDAPAIAGNGTVTPGPRIIVNAYGGGLRAAIFTAQVLALADDASCGEFGEHIQAMSGVSGGSLGIAVYLAARQELKPLRLWEGCVAGSDAHPLSTPLTDVVTEALVQDHLSPSIARMLSVDLLPLVPPQRGMAMLDSWNDALVGALKNAPPVRGDKAYAPRVTLAVRLGQLGGAILPPPRVYFNTTDADSGARRWFSNFSPNAESTSGGNVTALEWSGVTVGEAVLDSARFPVISPAGAFPPDYQREKVLPRRLVDGGYADNSGAQTLLDESRLWDTGSAPKVMLDINGNPPEAADDPYVTRVCRHKQPAPSHVPTSLLALLSARSAHALDGVVRLSRQIGLCAPGEASQACLHPVQFDLEKVYGVVTADDPHCDEVRNAQLAPLGWYTSSASSVMLRRSSDITVQQVCDLAGIRNCRVRSTTQ